MILSTWNFVYGLQLQSAKTICFCYVSHPFRLLMLFAIRKSISSVRPFIANCRPVETPVILSSLKSID